MPKKVSELAKELNMSSATLIKKLSSMGYDVKSATEKLADSDAEEVKNKIASTITESETKIVRARQKQASDTPSRSSNVEIKAVDISVIEAQAKAAARRKVAKAEATASVTSTKVPEFPQQPARPSSRPVPIGRPMPKNAVPQKKADVPQRLETDEVKEEALETKPAAPELVKPEEIKEPAPATEPQEAPVSEKAPASRAKKAKSADAVAEVDETLKVAADSAETEKAAKPAKKGAPQKTEGEKKPAAAKVEDKKKPAAVKAEAEKKSAEPKGESDKKKTVKAEGSKKAETSKTAAEKKAKEAKEEPARKAAAPKPEPPVDYTPGIGVKIIKRAADEPKEERKPVEPKSRKPEKRGDKTRPGKGSAKGERKPKDYIGPKADRRADKDADSPNPRRRSDGAAKRGDRKDGKVVAYTAPAGSISDKRRKDKDKRSRKDRFDAIPLDLSKSRQNKRSKYKDKSEPVDDAALEFENLAPGTYVITCPITVAGFCEQIERSSSEAIMALMKMGIMANINQNLDEETAVLLGMELGAEIVVKKVIEEEEEIGIDKSEDREADLLPRPPVVTVMGHVDHGKTSLLDAIRSSNVTAGEAGGITQHIGASEVEINGRKMVFLDTPGHEAFTAMRARGAHITDIAVLVVAADDGVMPQTIESISHAKAAGIPVIVAINKMDKPTANPDRVKTELSEHGILVEDWGGDTISVPVSAKAGTGIGNLLEMILLQADMLELKANPDRLAQGNVIEAKLDKARGPVATLLVTNGTLSAGSAIVAGTASGRIRVMTDWRGNTIPKAGPSRAVEITGLSEVPEAGDEFYAVSDDKTAREIAEKRREKLRQEVMAKTSSMSLEKLFSQLEEGEIKDLNLILKGDVQGSVGALEQSVEKLQNENVRVKIIHTGVGAVNESDVMLAETSNAVVIGFNVRPSSAVQSLADSKSVEIRCYRIIYEILDDIEAAMKGMLDPEFKEVIIGKAEVRETFKVPNVGVIAGAYVVEGRMARNAQLRLLRDGIVIHEGNLSSLKRFKDDAKEVAQGFECGIGIEKYNDIKEGDLIEAFKMEEVKRA